MLDLNGKFIKVSTTHPLDLTEMERLIGLGASINIFLDDNKTLLDQALDTLNLPLALFLMKHGAKTSVSRENGLEPLLDKFYRLKDKNDDINILFSIVLSRLIGDYQFNVIRLFYEGEHIRARIPLHHAVRLNDPGILDAILNRLSDYPDHINDVQHLYAPIPGQELSLGCRQYIESWQIPFAALPEQGGIVNSPALAIPLTALEYAMILGHTEIAKEIIKFYLREKLDIENLVLFNGGSLLHWAIKNDDPHLAEAIMNATSQDYWYRHDAQGKTAFEYARHTYDFSTCDSLSVRTMMGEILEERDIVLPDFDSQRTLAYLKRLRESEQKSSQEMEQLEPRAKAKGLKLE